MAITSAWTESAPLGTDFISAGDDEIRSLAQRVRERCAKAGIVFDTLAQANQGRNAIANAALNWGEAEGEWSIFDVLAATKILRLTDVNFATAADRNRMILDGTILAGIKQALTALFESNVADGASAIAFDFNQLTTLANAAAKMMRIQNNGVEKLAMDKDCLLTTRNVPEAGLSGDAATARSELTGSLADGTNVPASLTTITGCSVSYTPAGTGSWLLLIGSAHYTLSTATSQGHIELSIKVDGTTEDTASWDQNSTGSEADNFATRLVCHRLMVVPGAGPFTIEMQHIKTGAAVPVYQDDANYEGARLSILELKH
jgi:hypothetical protein